MQRQSAELASLRGCVGRQAAKIAEHRRLLAQSGRVVAGLLEELKGYPAEIIDAGEEVEAVP